MKQFVATERSPRYGTGFAHLDFALGGGLHRNQMLLVGGASGAGKSSLLERIALETAKFVPTTYVTLELEKQRVRERMLANLHATTVDGFYDDLMHDVDEYSLPAHETIERFDALQLHITGRQAIGDDEPWTARRCFVEAWANRSEVLLIDHARELDGWMDGTIDGSHAASKIAKQMQRLTHTAGLAVGIAHQLKLPPIHGNRRPTREMFFDTQQIGQSADAIILVHRPLRGEPGEDVAELLVDKNRNGPEGVQHVGYHAMRFVPIGIDAQLNARCCAAARAARAQAIRQRAAIEAKAES